MIRNLSIVAIASLFLCSCGDRENQLSTITKPAPDTLYIEEDFVGGVHYNWSGDYKDGLPKGDTFDFNIQFEGKFADVMKHADLVLTPISDSVYFKRKRHKGYEMFVPKEFDQRVLSWHQSVVLDEGFVLKAYWNEEPYQAGDTVSIVVRNMPLR